MKLGVCIPLCDRRYIPALRAALSTQRRQADDIVLLDSSPAPVAADDWPQVRICRISPATFDHGGARRLAQRLLAGADLLLFLTQDAVPADPHAFANLIAAFRAPEVGAAFGRQLPRLNAGPLEAHARLFNYPPRSRTTSAADIPRLGLKAAFISNSFAAYRQVALAAVAGFPERNIVSEDTLVAARMLKAGWKIAYCAGAKVYHSHSYSLGREFQRYFDIGVFHAREPWIRQQFGEAEKEGMRFVSSEFTYLLQHRPAAILSALVRLPVRYLGFRAGLGERFLPRSLRGRLSMQKTFWLLENGALSRCSRNKPSFSPD